MDCKSFARKHSAFVDDTLPGIEMAAMQAHRDGCPACERRDREIRRSLMLVRNLPRFAVSEGFEDRLRVRLARETRSIAPETGGRTHAVRWAAAAAVVTMLAGVAAREAMRDGDEQPVRLPAVVASAAPTPRLNQVDDQAPAIVASMSTALPMWPALMRAEEGSLRFAALELQQAVWEPSRD